MIVKLHQNHRLNKKFKRKRQGISYEKNTLWLVDYDRLLCNQLFKRNYLIQCSKLF